MIANKDGIIVSPTEPTTNRRKVWIQHSKNLFNKDTVLEGYSISGNTGAIAENANRAVSDFIPAKPNTEYILSSIVNTAICFYNSSMNFLTSVNTGTFTTPNNTAFIRFGINIETQPDYSEGQLEQGSTATNYEPYIEEAIYVKNDNDVYEEFVNRVDNFSQKYDMRKKSTNENDKYALLAEYTLLNTYNDFSDVIQINRSQGNWDGTRSSTKINIAGRRDYGETGALIRFSITYMEKPLEGCGFLAVLVDSVIKLYCYNSLQFMDITGKSLSFTASAGYQVRRYYIDQDLISQLPSGTVIKAVGPEIYSTSEQVIGSWIDGKPIYRKVIQYLPQISNGSYSTTDIPHNISNLKTIVRCDAFFEIADNTRTYPLPVNLQSGLAAGIRNIDTTNITVYSMNDSWSAHYLNVILEYTKTTD